MNPDDPAYPSEPTWEYRDPQAGDYTRYSTFPYGGLTKREYAAIRAMEGMLAAVVVPVEGIETKLALAAWKYADALFANKPK